MSSAKWPMSNGKGCAACTFGLAALKGWARAKLALALEEPPRTRSVRT